MLTNAGIVGTARIKPAALNCVASSSVPAGGFGGAFGLDFVKPWNNAEGVVMDEHRLSDVLCFAFANARRWDCPVDHWPVVQRDAPSALAYI